MNRCLVYARLAISPLRPVWVRSHPICYYEIVTDPCVVRNTSAWFTTHDMGHTAWGCLMAASGCLGAVERRSGGRR